ncbi:GGDEF domain-containing protein [Actinoplanes sp. NPDC020271]|uniref:GGDEF domain-containing protein n=1 Tax=Actinoplanes sp. NPDC020271 TaxID=3363896 RepID=UPI00379CFE1D
MVEVASERTLAYQSGKPNNAAPGRAGFCWRDRLARHLWRDSAHQDCQPPLATVLYCDLDDFKPTNDRFGHEAGDEVLRCVARRLTAALRRSDIVARVGGDEFLAYCPGVDQAAARLIRQSVEDALKEPMLWNGMTLTVGATVGTATSTLGGNSSSDALIAAADNAMYRRKRARKRISPMPTAAGETAAAGEGVACVQGVTSNF